jgi:hypothetical protein
VSVSYLIRREQGQSLNASPQVLEALARALQLDEVERRHLYDLSASGRELTRRSRSAPERVSPPTRDLLAAFGDSPAIVLGRRSDVLAWNGTGHALLAGHLDFESPEQPSRRPNTARMVFLDAHTRELYAADWPRKARDVVGKLRLAVGRFPDDARLSQLVGELTTKSPRFAELWSEKRVRAWDIAEYRMHHPVVGAMTVTQQSLNLPLEQSLRIVVITAAPGSGSQAPLALLSQLTTPSSAQSVPAMPH